MDESKESKEEDNGIKKLEIETTNNKYYNITNEDGSNKYRNRLEEQQFTELKLIMYQYIYHINILRIAIKFIIMQ